MVYARRISRIHTVPYTRLDVNPAGSKSARFLFHFVFFSFVLSGLATEILNPRSQ